MIKETPYTKEAVKRQKFCDICGKEIHIGLSCSKAKCDLCGKDLCEECIGNEDATYGDYRSVTCAKCWAIGEDYLPHIEGLRIKMDELYDEWRYQCKKQ